MKTLLTLEYVRFAHRRSAPLFTDLGLELGDGGPVALLGLNGAGKTTLLRLCAGELRPSAGSIRTSEGSLRSAVSLMPQQIRTLPGFRVVEQVAYAAWLGGCRPADSKERAMRALEAVDLLTRAAERPEHLSGGQLRRVGLAQALVGEQPVVLLDEPTAGLDPAQRRAFRTVLADLGDERQFVVSTHDTAEIDASFERVVVLHQGRIAFDGPTSDFLGHAAGGERSAEEALLAILDAAERA